MLDLRLAAQGKPAVAAFFREHGFSSELFPENGFAKFTNPPQKEIPQPRNRAQ
jgi:hypothetical protein